MTRQSLLPLLAVLLLLAAAGPVAAAGDTARLPEAFEGLGVSGDDPIQFQATTVEIREKEQVAIFSGEVVVRQNNTVLRTARLIVTYAAGGAEGTRRVSRLEADGSVLVTSGEQTASGERAVFDTADNTIVVTGQVVLTQGKNVIRGNRLVVDIDSGQARMEGGRVQMLIEPGTLKGGGG